MKESKEKPIYVKILMKESKQGSPDGMHTLLYKKGEEYELPEKLARIFIEDLDVAQLAEQQTEEVVDYDPDLNLNLGGTKSVEPSYENKVEPEKGKGKKGKKE